jgi:SecD/SecF fusion protein
MQGKGVVKFFLVVMTLVTLAQYLFILPTRKVEKKADAYAQSLTNTIEDESVQREAYKKAYSEYLDSMSSEEVFKIPLLKSYTYQELKSQQLALGLDLKGGLSVVLQVDLREFIRTLAQSSKDPTFEKALDQATEAQKSSQSDFVTLFADAWRANAGSDERLAPIFQRNEALRDEINYNTSDAEVISVLRSKANETVDLTFNLLKERIDKLGVAQPNVSLDGERDLILVELPGIDNAERAKGYLQATAELAFWNVYGIDDAAAMQALIDINNRLAETEDMSIQEEMRYDTTYVVDSLGNPTADILSVDTVPVTNPFNQGPLFSLLTPNTSGTMGRAVLATAERNKIRQIDRYLAREDIRALLPSDMMFLWSRDPMDFDGVAGADNYALYGIRKDRSGQPPLTGEHVTTASAQPDPTTNQVAVSLKMDGTGGRIWGDLTTAAAQDQNREIAIVLDSQVVSAPRVINPILTGDSQITGDFSIQEANDLANILQVGRLPARTQIIQSSLVGPSLGQENINKSITAMVIGMALLLAFMIVYYGGGGIVAIIALVLNLFFVFGALASIGTVLTLPGVAGVILTIGMAVDANVIIFERIREELREGKSLLMAIGDGFKNSYSAIIDANVTTILVAMVLAYFGMGPIKGFAVVLIIGVLSSLFTAVLVGRLIIDSWTKSGRSLSFWTKPTENAFANMKIDWMGKRRLAYMISGTVIVLGLAAMFTRKFDLGVDFKGGYSYNVTFAAGQQVDAEQLRAALTPVFDGHTPTVKAVDTYNTYNIVTDYLIGVEDKVDGLEPEEKVMEQLFAGINSITADELSLDDFKDTDGTGTHVTASSQVGPTIADDIKRRAFYAGILALLVIFLYIFLRFSKWQYSLGAVAALFHDSLIVLGIFAMFHGILPFSMEIDQAFIAAILTVIGYSINDTVIVFDRIREYLNNYTKTSKMETINAAINSTVSRTVITSLTTLFTITVLFIFGGSSIKGFAFAIMVGIIVGTYSSIFIATPIMADLTGELEVKEKANTKKGSFTRAASTAK